MSRNLTGLILLALFSGAAYAWALTRFVLGHIERKEAEADKLEAINFQAWTRTAEQLERVLTPEETAAFERLDPLLCEVCKSNGVTRSGNWDYCPNGHTYVGKRAERNE